MAFDIDGARKAGYSDDEIAAHLQSDKDVGFDIAGAQKAGYSPSEILSFIGEQPAKKGFIDRAKEIVTNPFTSKTDEKGNATTRGVDVTAMPGQFKSGVAGMQSGYFANNAKNAGLYLNAMDRVDRGERLTMDQDPLGYQDMTAAQRADTRAKYDKNITANVADAVKYHGEKAGYVRNQSVAPFIDLLNKDQYGKAWEIFKSDPGGILQQMTVENTPNMIPSIAGGGLGVALKGGVAGMMAGLASGSYPVEYISSITESLQSSGIDLNDTKAVEAKLRDPKFIKDAGQRANTRGTVIAGMDAVAGKLLLPLKAGAGAVRNVGAGAANVGIEVGTEMAGEAGAQVASGEKIKMGEVIAEGIGAGPMTFASTALKTATQPKALTPDQEIAKAIQDAANGTTFANTERDALISMDPNKAITPWQTARTTVPTVSDIGAATSVDEAIRTAQAVVNTPNLSSQQQSIAELEASAGLATPAAPQAAPVPAPASAGMISEPAPQAAIQAESLPDTPPLPPNATPAEMLQWAQSTTNPGLQQAAIKELKRRETDFAYQQAEAAKQADFAKAREQQADQQIAQAGAVTDAQGFNDQPQTAMQIAMQQAKAKLEGMRRTPVNEGKPNDQKPVAAAVPVRPDGIASAGPVAATAASATPQSAPAAPGNPVGKANPVTSASVIGKSIPAANAAADQQPALTPKKSEEIAGRDIDTKWTEFSKDSGTLGINRAEMPQIKSEHRGAMVNFLNARGIAHEQGEVSPDSLKATQREFSPSKVAKAKSFTGNDRSILVSSDGHVLDGHHQWLAKREAGEPVKVIRLDAPIKKLLEEVAEFPSAATAAGATEAKTEKTLSPKMQDRQQKTADLEKLTSKELRAIAGNKKQPAYMKNAAADILQVRDQENRAKRSDVAKKVYAKSKSIDPDRDTMAQAIAKLGGINRESAAGRLRLAPEELNRRGAGLRPLFHANGRSMDEIGAMLAELGYVQRDENGKHDQTDFEDKLAEVAGGSEVLTPNGMMTRAQEEQAQAMAEVGAESAEEYDAIEQYADSMPAYTEEDVEALLSQPLSIEDGMRAMGFTEQEIQDELSREKAQTGPGAINAESAGEPAQESAAGDEAPEFGLESESAADAQARLDQAEEQTRAKELESRRLDEVEKQARIQKEIDSRQAASADNFQLGQSAEDSLAGQQDIFSTPQAAPQASTRSKLNDIAKRLEIYVDEVNGGYQSGNTAISIPAEDAQVEGAVSPDHVFAHELGHAIMQKRQVSFSGFPKAEVTRYIQNYEDLISASKEYRPGVHSHQNDKYRRHAMKPNEIVADAIGAVLLGEKPIALLQPLMDKMGWSIRDLGLEAKGESVIQPTTKEEAADLIAQSDMPTAEQIKISALLRKGDVTPADVAAVLQPERIDDLGEKIGGARKDTAQSGMSRNRVPKDADDAPAWRKRFSVLQNVASSSNKWIIVDTRTDKAIRESYRVKEFDTEQEAIDAIPLIAVAQKHRVTLASRSGEPQAFEIWRDVTDRKRVKVVKQQFSSREDAMRYMAANAAEILETKTGFGEEILAKPEKVMRSGAERRTGKVDGKSFMDAFGFRGVEFGNWNNQDERQEIMNHAYDGLMDLAETLGIPPKALSLNGDLALAFGARGQGLTGARAHYERDYGVMNLTKMQGAGALAHEWFHSLDHYFGRQDGKASSEKETNARGDLVYKSKGREGDYVSHGFRYTNSGVREEVRQAYEKLIVGMFKKAETYVEDTEKAEKFVGASRDDLRNRLGEIRKDLERQLDPIYYKRNNKPASAEQLAEFDQLANALVAGDDLATEYRLNNPDGKINGRARAAFAGRRTNDVLEKLSAIYKAVRGRTGFSAENKGALDSVRGAMTRYADRIKMLVDASEGAEKSKNVPTSYAMESKNIDQGRSTDYWTTPHEMAARAFSAYVEDKIGEQGNRSDFLSYGSDNRFYAMLGLRPFPEGKERQAINKDFDQFFSVLDTKETDTGTALYKRDSMFSIGMDASDVKAEAERLAAKWENAPKITVVQSTYELPFDAPSDARGAYYRGQVWLVADNLPEAADTQFVLFHEIMGHAGLRGMFGDRIMTEMQYIGMKNENVRKAAAKWRAQNADIRGKRSDMQWNAISIEETLADIAGAGQEIKGIEKLLAFIQGKLRDFGLDAVADWMESRSNAEALKVLAMARNFIEQGERQSVFGTQEAQAYQRKTDSAMSRSGVTNAPASRSSDIAFSRKPQSTWSAEAPSKMDDFIYTMQDKQVDTRRVVQGIRETMGAIQDNWNPYLQEELFHGRSAKQVSDFLGNELKPLLTEMQARGIQPAEFEEFLHMRHAEERNNQIAKVNPDMPDGGSGIDTADARAYLAGLTQTKRSAYQALAKRIDAINKATRQILIDSGLEKAETIAAWEGAYQYYVPLQREESGQGVGQGFSVRGSSSKRAMGSRKAVINVLANLAMQRERTIVRAEKNRVSTALYGLAITAPNPDFWVPVNPGADIGRKLASLEKERLDRKAIDDKQAKFSFFVRPMDKIDADIAALKAQRKKAIDDLVGLGINPIDAEKTFSEPTEQYVDPRTGLVAERVNPFLRSAPNVLSTRVNGEDRYVFFNEDDERATRMVKALKNLDADQLGRILSMSAKVTRYFSAINTQYNPIFGVINLTRDVQGALLNLSTTPIAGKQAAVMAHTVSALRGIYIDTRDHRAGKTPNSSWAALYEEFQDAGGQTGYRDMFSNSQERADALSRELKKITEGKVKMAGRAIFDWLSDYNTTMENAVRLAAYKVAKEQGLSIEQAASMAKNLTVNFNRKGQVATQAGALYAFFNASVQGTTRLAETLRGPAGKKIIMGGLLLGSMQALLLAFAGFDEDEPPEFIRSRNIIIPIGNGKYLTVPMPLGFNLIPNMSRIVTEFVLGGFKNPTKKLISFLDLFADTFNPIGNAGFSLQTIAPTAIDPLAALAENRDFTGKPIAREQRSGLAPTPGHTRAKDTASEISKTLSYWLNIASGGTKYQPGAVSPTPDQLDYLIAQATGGVGRELLKVEQTVTSVMTGEDLPAYKIPLAGRFYGDTKEQAGATGKFYENLKTINQHEAEIKGRRKDKGDVMGYIRDNPESRLVQAANNVERDLQKLRQRKRDLLERSAGKDSIKLVEQQMNNKMQQFNNRVRSVREKERVAETD